MTVYIHVKRPTRDAVEKVSRNGETVFVKMVGNGKWWAWFLGAANTEFEADSKEAAISKALSSRKTRDQPTWKVVWQRVIGNNKEREIGHPVVQYVEASSKQGAILKFKYTAETARATGKFVLVEQVRKTRDVGSKKRRLSKTGDKTRDESKAEWLTQAKHAKETAERAVAKGMHEVAAQWMQKAAEYRRLAAKTRDCACQEVRDGGTEDATHTVSYREGRAQADVSFMDLASAKRFFESKRNDPDIEELELWQNNPEKRLAIRTTKQDAVTRGGMPIRRSPPVRDAEQNAAVERRKKFLTKRLERLHEINSQMSDESRRVSTVPDQIKAATKELGELNRSRAKDAGKVVYRAHGFSVEERDGKYFVKVRPDMAIKGEEIKGPYDLETAKDIIEEIWQER